MRKLPFGKGVIAALKADTPSLIAWQIGMYCQIAFWQFAIFKRSFDAPAPSIALNSRVRCSWL
jgi:hypothetical protein